MAIMTAAECLERVRRQAAQDEADRAAGAATLDDAALRELREDRANGAALRLLVDTYQLFTVENTAGDTWRVAIGNADVFQDTLPEAVAAALAAKL